MNANCPPYSGYGCQSPVSLNECKQECNIRDGCSVVQWTDDFSGQTRCCVRQDPCSLDSSHLDTSSNSQNWNIYVQRSNIRRFVWSSIHENTNCFVGAGAEENLHGTDGSSWYDVLTSISECQSICELDDTCNCITFYPPNGNCWMRKNCDVDQCNTQSQVQVMTATSIIIFTLENCLNYENIFTNHPYIYL